MKIRIIEYVLTDMLNVLCMLYLSNIIIRYRDLVIKIGKLEDLFFVLLAILIIPLLLYLSGSYRSSIKETKVFALKTDLIMLAVLQFAFLIITLISYFLDLIPVKTGLISCFAITLSMVLLLERFLIRICMKLKSRREYSYKNILIIGFSESGMNYISYIEKNCFLDMRVVGNVYIREKESYDGILQVGELEDLPEIVKYYVVDEIVVAKPLSYDERMRGLLNVCQDMGITITMLLECQNVDESTKTQAAMIGGIPVLKFHSVSLNETQLLVKRIVDIIGAMVGLLFFALAFTIFALFIKIETPGPILFKQNRVGKNGRVFKIWKFRTMGEDAELQKAALISNNQMSGHMFKMDNDPRVTGVGSFLRKTSLDELPQFWNVLIGDMSLVGPRPPTVNEVKNYEIHHHKRISIAPGITGKWQVSGRSSIKNFEEVVKLDIEYIETWTIMNDIKIIIKTLLIVLTQRGSC